MRKCRWRSAATNLNRRLFPIVSAMGTSSSDRLATYRLIERTSGIKRQDRPLTFRDRLF